ncbi:putative transposase, partial [Rhodococcus wratislaviensis IFP 2016]
ETRMLLDEHGHHVTPTIGLRFSTAADLAGFLRDGTAPVPTPNRPLPEALSHPALTGMSRRQLGDLVERLAVRQAAMVERRRYAQRGGERMPGGRGGIFLQKITDAERVLATVLHMRQLCNRAVLAELFQVSPRTIGNALLDVRPLLEQDFYTPAPATIRYRTAAALLAAIPPREGDTPESTH